MDSRIEQVQKIVLALVTKGLLKYTDVLITENNICVIVLNKTQMFEVELHNIVEPLPPIAFNADILSLDYNDIGVINNDILLYNDLINCYTAYKNIEATCEVVAEEKNLRSNEEFEKLLSLKSGDGLKFYNIIGNGRQYSIPMFSTFIKLNKQDTIDIKILDLKDGYLVMQMNIFKKKINRNVNSFVRILDI